MIRHHLPVASGPLAEHLRTYDHLPDDLVFTTLGADRCGVAPRA